VTAPAIPSGFRLLPARLDEGEQLELVKAVARIAEAAPFVRPITPGGQPMSVLQTGCGPLSWITDRKGYRYEPAHPATGQPWPPMPPLLAELWAELCDAETRADACLINRYDGDARMGLHRDTDEADFAFPVLSISLGDTAMFRLGGLARSDPTRSFRLASGDVMILAGASRLAHHGVDRILAGSSRLVPGGGRLNLTLRRARPAA